MGYYDRIDECHNTGLEACIGKDVLIVLRKGSSSGPATDDPWNGWERENSFQARLLAVKKEGLQTEVGFFYFGRIQGYYDDENPVGHKGGWEDFEKILHVECDGTTIYKKW